MIVHFVRHGEYLIQNPPIFPSDDIELSKVGEEQAGEIGKIINGLSIDRIISSPVRRALQTAEIIGRELKIPIETSDLFVERRRPSKVISKLVDDPECKRIIAVIKGNYHKPGYRYSDEENFLDLKRRGQTALKYIVKLGVENPLVVTHSEFLAMILSLMTLGQTLGSQQFTQTKHFFSIPTGAIINCERNKFGWKLAGMS